MSIRKKTLLIIAITFLVITSALYFLSSVFLLDGFRRIEQDLELKNLSHLSETLLDSLSNLEDKSADWAVWDDSYNFILDGNQEFIESNLNNLALDLLDINLILFIRTDGKQVYSKYYSLKEKKDYKIPQDILDHFSNKSLLLENDELKKGFINTSLGPMMIVKRSLLTSQAEGPSNGFLVFGKIIDDNSLLSYSRLIKAPLEMVLVSPELVGSSTAVDFDEAKDVFLRNRETKTHIKLLDTKTIADYLLVDDLYGNPLVILKITNSREIYKQGITSIHYIGLVMGIMLVLGTVLILSLLENLVVKHVSRLSRDITNIAECTDDCLLKVREKKGEDEISKLTKSINKMLVSLDQSTKTLKDEKYKIQKYLEVIGSSIVILDLSGKVLLINKAGCRLLGYEEKEIVGKEWFTSFIPENIKDNLRYMFERISNREINIEYFESPIVTKDGRERILMWHNSLLEDSQSKAHSIVMSGEDITERIAADEKIIQEKQSVERKVEERTKELNDEHAKLKAAINSTPEGFLLLDTKENVVITNQEFYGIIDGSISIQTIGDVAKLIENTGVDIVANYKTCLKTREPVEFKDLSFGKKYLSIFIRPVLEDLEEDRELIGILILINDITEVKVMERSRDEFFSIASHELRTPLTAIRGNISLILEHFKDLLKDKLLKEMLEDTYAASVRLIGIVNDFLTTSRLEMGKMEFKRERFDIFELSTEVVKTLSQTALDKGIYLRVEDTLSQNKAPLALGDKEKCREVLINLIGNSIKFTQKGGVSIRFVVQNELMKVLVTDTGDGISESSRSLLFRKFQQANESLYTRDPQRSTGLGLYITRLMAEAMGGKVVLEESTVGVGSTFSFTLPTENV
ncbi:MAG: CHASE4 domain-containing protein [Patescibacteria group bacterium]